jgi:hypothetical protein
MKYCWVCERELPVEEFSRDKTKKDGLNGRCKSCDSSHRSKWKKDNKEHHNNFNKEKGYGKKRAMQQKCATPKWAKKDVAKHVRFLKSIRQGDQELDHIVPILNDTVCGLHVPSNVRLIPTEDNRKKGNNFDGGW